MTINTWRHWGVAAAALLAAACQHAAPPPDPAPPQQVETGSAFNLQSPLVFPAGSSELLFQNERVVSMGDLAIAPKKTAAKKVAAKAKGAKKRVAKGIAPKKKVAKKAGTARRSAAR